jgi:transcriptional regulator with XRE-family HTH domain
MDARALTKELTTERLDAHVARRLRECRMKKGITLATVAEGASTSYQQIQKYESGRDRISAGRLYQLSLTLAVPIRYFFRRPA